MEHVRPIILFIDRDLAAERGLRMELRRRGARVRVATTVAEADAVIAQEPPDLVVLDGALGEKEDLAEHVRERCPRAELIVLDSKPSDTPRGVGLGLLYCGIKPAPTELLLDVISSAFPGGLDPAPAEKGKAGMVLCVDDDPLYLKSISRTLVRHGYRVLPYEDSNRALEALRNVSPDVAILDIMMPGIDGLDLAEAIRDRSGGRVPVVFLTALNSEEACYESHERGACFFLTKPVESSKVLDVVDYLAGDLDEDERALLKSRI